MIRGNRDELGMWNPTVQVSSGRRLVALGFALLVAWLLVVAVASDTWASDNSAELAANPELSAARRWARDTSGSTVMAANPELAAAGRYAHSTSRSQAMAANPELMAVGRFSGAVSRVAAGQQNSASFFAANPEVMTARRYSRPVSDCGVALGC